MPTPGQRKGGTISIDLTEFRRGWKIIVLATLGVSVTATASFLYVFGTLTIPLQHAFGWSRAEIQSGLSFLFGGAVVGAQGVGWLNARWGMRRVTVLSLIALAATFALMPWMGHSVKWFYLLCALLPVAGLGTTQITWSNLLIFWFERNRGLALAAILSGTGLSAMCFPSAVTWVIGRWDLKAGFLLLAAIPFALVLPLALLWMKIPAAPRAVVAVEHDTELGEQGVSFSQAIRSKRYWSLTVALCLIVAAVVSMVGTTVPLLRDKGLSAADASRIFGSFGVTLLGGRMVVGYLFDRFWAPGVAALTLLMPALGCLLLFLVGAQHVDLLVLATMLLGIGTGAEFDIATFLLVRYFGMRDYGRLFSLQFSLTTLSAAIAPWLFGLLYSATGGYSAMLLICSSAFVAGALLLLPLGRYPRFDALRLA